MMGALLCTLMLGQVLLDPLCLIQKEGLLAVDVNRSRMSPFPQITEDMVWLSPGWLLNLEDLEKILTIYELMLELERGEEK